MEDLNGVKELNLIKCSLDGVQVLPDYYKINEPVNLNFVRKIKLDKTNRSGCIWFEFAKDDKVLWSYDKVNNWEQLMDADYKKIILLCK